MKLSDYQIIFVSICLIGVLLIASPALAEIIKLPSGEPFSELFLLDTNNMTQDIPFNIIPGQTYSVNLGVGNNLDATTYYVCILKLRNQTEPFPNSTTQTASPLPPIYKHHLAIKDGENTTIPLTFSITATQTKSVLTLQSITINDIDFNVNKIVHYDQDNKGYYCQLFVELWAYNPQTEEAQYQNRWVYFWINIT